MKFLKEHWIVSLVLLVALTATAAKIGDDLVKIGKPGSTADKEIVFDVGDGASNPSIVVDTTDKDFDFNKAMNIAGDLLKVGDGTNSNKEVIFDIGSGVNNPRFRWNSVNNVLEFALDGTTFRAIGSGSGGASGVNLLAEANFDFELGSPPDDWTASGGTFSTESAEPIFGDQSGAWDSDADAQTLCSSAVQIERGFLGRTCQAEIEYRYDVGTAGDYKLSAVDTGSEVAFIDLAVTPTGEARKAQLVFDCPDTNTDTLQLCLESQVADADPIEADEAFIGTGRNTFNFSQAGLYSKYTWPGTANCEWVRSSGTATWGSFGADSDCPDPTIEGQGSTPASKIPQMILNDMPSGRYIVYATGGFINDGGTNSGNLSCAIVDEGGNEVGSFNATRNSGDDRMTPETTMTGEFSVSANANKTLEYQCLSNGSDTVSLQNAFTVVGPSDFKMWVYRYPENVSEAITLETSGEYWEATITSPSTAANLPLSGNVFSWTSIGSSGLVMAQEQGSAPVEIPCNTGTASTGLTCSGADESVGIVFEIHSAGAYQVCSQFHHEMNINTGGTDTNWRSLFQLIETNNADFTQLQEGGAKAGNSFFSGSSNSDIDILGRHITVCSDFVFNSVGKKTVRLHYQQFDGGQNLDVHRILADDATNATPNIHFSVKKINQQIPTPVFTDLQDSLNSKIQGSVNGLKIYQAYIDGQDGTPNVDRSPDGTWIDSITDGGVGDYRINFAPGIFPSNNDYNCIVSTQEVARTIRNSDEAGGTAIDCNVASSGAVTDCDFSIICMGL